MPIKDTEHKRRGPGKKFMLNFVWWYSGWRNNRDTLLKETIGVAAYIGLSETKPWPKNPASAFFWGQYKVAEFLRAAKSYVGI